MKCKAWNREYGEMEVALIDLRTNKAKCIIKNADNVKETKWFMMSTKDKGSNYCTLMNLNIA